MIEVITREADFRDLMSSVQGLMDSDVATATKRKMVIAGLRPIGKAQKPVVSVKSGRLRKATGNPVFSSGRGKAARQKIARAVVGLNTGKRGPSRAPHGAIWAMGTQVRVTKRGHNRGRSPSHLVIRSASVAAAPQGIAAMRAVLASDMPRIVAAARKPSTRRSLTT